MTSEQKQRIKKADSKLEDAKKRVQEIASVVDQEVAEFGDYRGSVLQETVSRFKSDLNIIGKKLKSGDYDIPSGFEMPDVINVTLKKVAFTVEQKLEITNNVVKAVSIGTDKILQMIAKRKGVVYNNPSSPAKSGFWWLDLLQVGLDMAVGYSQKKMEEEKTVEEYESNVDRVCSQADMQIEFCYQILERLEEIITVTNSLKERCICQLNELEEIINMFDVEKDKHIKIYQKAVILVKGISELAKIEILGTDEQLSKKDDQYIIKSKKLLSETL